MRRVPIQRRDFLRGAGAGFAWLSLPGFESRRGHEREPARTLVVLYLRGGIDALNVVVPYRDERYYELRPTLAIPPDDAIALNGKFGLHPSLRALEPFWRDERLAPILNVGSPHPTRSHFDAQDFMEYAAPGDKTVKDGWLNRFLRLAEPSAEDVEEAGLRALAMQGLLPRSLRGDYSVLAVPTRSVLADEEMTDTFQQVYGGASSHDEMVARDEPVLATGATTLEALRRFREITADAEESATTSYPGSKLGRNLRTLSHVIRTGQGLEVAAMDLGGWDTHANQGGITGTMPDLLQDLGDSLAAFMTDLGKALERTLIVTMSEFGRTCAENGNFGTDHGHGGIMLLMGAGVRGGRLHGKWRGLDPGALYEGRDLEVTTDFRDVFREVLRSHLGFDTPRDFFPGYRSSRVKGLF